MDSSDSEDEMYDIVEFVDEVNNINKRRKIYKKRENPFQTYDDIDFKQRYRLSKESANKILNIVRHALEKPNMTGRPIPPEIQVLATIRYLAKGCYQVESADLHGFSQSTLSRIVARVTREIASHINDFIKFPSSAEEIQIAKEDFYKIAHFPNVIGCIDCTHIKIKNPGGDVGEYYRNRKGYFSLNCQVICDAKLRITNIVARWRGSAHDARIWDMCNIKNKFENGEINGILLGDSGYGCTRYLLTLLLNPTTPSELRYNSAHITTRNSVERLFGLWKNKFRCFFNGLGMSLDTAKAAIIMCAILHNISRNDNIDDEDIEINNAEDEDDEPVQLHPAQQIRGNANIFRQNFILRHFSN